MSEQIRAEQLRDGDRFTTDDGATHCFAIAGFGTVSCYVSGSRSKKGMTYRIDLDKGALVTMEDK